MLGAEGGSRTPTGVTPLDFESSASASSATSATFTCYAGRPTLSRVKPVCGLHTGGSKHKQ